jgi:superfamily I DNA and RNA helicase
MNTTWWVGDADLDEDQVKIATLPAKGSHLITGPPGSGKTNLLLLRGNYLTLANQPDILIFVFTRTLQEFLRLGAAAYKFPVDKIQNYTSWQKAFLWQHGVDAHKGGGFEEDRAKNFEKLVSLVHQKKLANVYDAILVDEGQDYLPEEIRLFDRLGTVLYAAADTRQKIYKGEDPMTALIEATDQQHPLRFHYRNGRRICRLADGVAKALGLDQELAKTCQYKEGERPSSVELMHCDNIQAQCDLVVTSLKTQMKAYPEDMLGVLCPRQEDLKQVWAVLSASEIGQYCILQSAKDGYEAFDLSRRVCVCTIHSAKGLEFRTVHVPSCEYAKRFQHQRNLLYTAITRAKTSLTLYHCGPIPGYLESAWAKLNPAANPPDIKQLFGGKTDVDC